MNRLLFLTLAILVVASTQVAGQSSAYGQYTGDYGQYVVRAPTTVQTGASSAYNSGSGIVNSYNPNQVGTAQPTAATSNSNYYGSLVSGLLNSASSPGSPLTSPGSPLSSLMGPTLPGQQSYTQPIINSLTSQASTLGNLINGVGMALSGQPVDFSNYGQSSQGYSNYGQSNQVYNTPNNNYYSTNSAAPVAGPAPVSGPSPYAPTAPTAPAAPSAPGAANLGRTATSSYSSFATQAVGDNDQAVSAESTASSSQLADSINNLSAAVDNHALQTANPSQPKADSVLDPELPASDAVSAPKQLAAASNNAPVQQDASQQHQGAALKQDGDNQNQPASASASNPARGSIGQVGTNFRNLFDHVFGPMPAAIQNGVNTNAPPAIPNAYSAASADANAPAASGVPANTVRAANDVHVQNGNILVSYPWIPTSNINLGIPAEGTPTVQQSAIPNINGVYSRNNGNLVQTSATNTLFHPNN